MSDCVAVQISVTPDRMGVDKPNPNCESWTVSDGKYFWQKLVDGMTLPPFGNSNPAVKRKRAELLMKNKQLQNPAAIAL